MKIWAKQSLRPIRWPARSSNEGGIKVVFGACWQAGAQGETEFMNEASKNNIPADKLVRVTFQPEGRTAEFEFGTLPYEHHGKPMSFLDVAENFNIFLDHACGGVCACTTCHLWIKDQTGVSEADDDEIDRMDMAADQQLESRLGCQAVITRPGNYVVEIPKWNRNYVQEGKPATTVESK